MSFRGFVLQPFPEAGPAPSLKIAGEIFRVSNRLAIRYELSDYLGESLIPVLSNIPIRKKNLWNETCFEFFLAVKNSPRYREFNLSPAGHWNIYSFEAYRQGMQEDAAALALPYSAQFSPNALSLSLEIDLDRIIHIDQVLEVGISAVIKHSDGMMSYWSLSHPGPQADFHHRDGFLIELHDEGQLNLSKKDTP
jgi:hypothetical protein